MTSYVYFIRPVGAVGPIKIGTSIQPQQRLVEMLKWSPTPLEIIATAPGGHKLEQQLHKCFAHAHSHFEWFAATNQLLAGIEAVKRGEAIEKAFDLSQAVGPIRTRRPRTNSYSTPAWRERASYAAKLRYVQHAHDGSAPKDVEQILHYSRRGLALSDQERERLNTILNNPQQHLIFRVRA